MSGLRTKWLNFRVSRLGWGILVSLLAVSLIFFAAALAVFIGMPWFLKGTTSGVEVILGITFPIALLATSVLVARYLGLKRGYNNRELLGWCAPDKKALRFVPLAPIVYIGVLLASLTVLRMISPGLANQEQDVAVSVSSMVGWRLTLMVFSIAILSPIVEETLFRGLLTSLYNKRLKAVTAIVLSSILFGLAHGQLNVSIDTFLFGLMLGFITLKTRSIFPSIGLHALKNTLALGMILNWKFF